MNMRKCMYLIVASLILIISGSLYSHAETTSVTSSPDLVIVIVDAYYTDLEDNGNLNDIYSELYITFYSRWYINNLYLYLELELPSGAYYSYLFLLQFVGIQTTILPVSFYNHATECGNYTLFAMIWFPGCANTKVASSISIFDPPGGHDDSGDPPWISVG
ncbi:MAG: hypothetical protein ACTSYD_12125 [Candidatus Heimdallarchaeaceae archaeon]